MSTILQRVDYSVTVIAWLIGLVLMIISIIVGNCYNSISFLIYSSFYTYLSFRENNRCRIEINTRTTHEMELLAQKAETERKEAENSAKELRHMIANVAHDLKTVSFKILFKFYFFHIFLINLLINSSFRSLYQHLLMV